MVPTRNRMTRFSLLLLDDGEVLVSDVACEYCLTVKPGGLAVSSTVGRLAGATRTGRLKIATRNIFFDSDDWRDPVLKIPISSMSCVSISRATPPPRNANIISNNRVPHSSSNPRIPNSPTRPADVARSYPRIGSMGHSPSSTPRRKSVDSVIVDSDVLIFQRENGTDHPYVEEQVNAKHDLVPTFADAAVLEAEIQSLKNINSIPSRKARDSALREIVFEREQRVPFDITLLQQGVSEEACGDYAASAIYALSRAPGRVRITGQNFYFMPIHGDVNRSVVCIPLSSLVSIRRLRHGCTNAAMELAFSENDPPSSASDPPRTLMLSFQTPEAREEAFETLKNSSPEKKLDIYGKDELDLALTKWRRGDMSNYDYLMYLNFAAGRSFNDLSQYPVFPWVLSDYESRQLDLDDPNVFRDLTKPIGALDDVRLATLKERFLEMPPPRFFYGTHYSTPAYVINYLVRAAPGAMLRLQNGRFDMPDRLFHSMADTWKGVCTNQADNKELLPEFYTLDYSSSVASGILSPKSAPGQFLDNVLGLELGTRQDGKRVDAVELPPWANGSTRQFVEKMREALEGKITSENLHFWIDLIFGVKVRSEKAHNIFYTDVALPKSIDSLSKRQLNSDDVNQMETIYLEFGRTPEQLFFSPHPPRFDQEANAPSLTPQPSLIPIVNSISGTQIGAQPQIDETSSDASVSPEKKGIGTPKRGSRNNSLLNVLQGIMGSPKKEKLDTDEASGTLRGSIIETHSMAETIDEFAEIIDATLVALTGPREKEGKLKESPRRKTREKSHYGICTVWNDGYLKVHDGAEMLRSRYIKGISSLVTMDEGLIGYGTSDGSIGCYQIKSGKGTIIERNAHESRITSLSFVGMLSLLVSGSKDGGVKVWQLQKAKTGACALLCALELDGENSIHELAATYDDDGSTITRAKEEDLEWAVRRILITALTKDGNLLAWRPVQYTAGDCLLEPVWKRSVGESKGEGMKRRRICWLAQKRSTQRSIAVTSACWRFVRQWIPGKERAEVVIECKNVTCVAGDEKTPTVIVADQNGMIAEFDDTGLRVGKRITSVNNITRLLIRPDGTGAVALSDEKQIINLTF